MTIFSEETLKKLTAPIHPDNVSERTQGNQTLSYVEAVNAIRAANGLFGFGNWGYKVKSGPTMIMHGARDNGKNWYVWQETVTLTVRTESGQAIEMDGVGASIQAGDGPEAAEMAIKGADTDALKRALKNYGNQFGLSLYDKDDARNVESNYREWKVKVQAQKADQPTDATLAPSEASAPAGEPAEPVPVTSLKEKATAMGFRERPAATEPEPEPEPETEGWGEDETKPAEEDEWHMPTEPSAIAAWKATRLWGTLSRGQQEAICNFNKKGEPTTVKKELAPFLQMSLDETKSWFKQHKLTASLAGAMLEAMVNIEDDEPNKRYELTVLTDEHLAYFEKMMPGRTNIDLAYEAVEWCADKLRQKSHTDAAKKWLEENPRP